MTIVSFAGGVKLFAQTNSFFFLQPGKSVKQVKQTTKNREVFFMFHMPIPLIDFGYIRVLEMNYLICFNSIMP
jgi:hypothetical protein